LSVILAVATIHRRSITPEMDITPTGKNLPLVLPSGDRPLAQFPNYTELQQHLLERFEAYLSLQEKCHQDPTVESWKGKLIDRATYSAYLDCKEQGLMSAANLLMYSNSPSEQTPQNAS
jgi:hypothetical protein